MSKAFIPQCRGGIPSCIPASTPHQWHCSPHLSSPHACIVPSGAQITIFPSSSGSTHGVHSALLPVAPQHNFAGGGASAAAASSSSQGQLSAGGGTHALSSNPHGAPVTAASYGGGHQMIPRGVVSGASGSSSSMPTAATGVSFQDVITRTSNPQRGDLLLGERVININGSGLGDGEIGVLVQRLQYQALNLDRFDASNNHLGFRAVESLLYTFRLGSPTGTYNIRFLDLSNNRIGDDAAEYMASHLSAGLQPNLKRLDVSGNPITPTGYKFFADAMKFPAVQNFMVTFMKQAALSGKAVVKGALQTFVAHAKERGVDTTHVATNKEAVQYLIDGTVVAGNAAFGYRKCTSTALQIITLDTNVTSLTIDFIAARHPVSRVINLIACIIMETHNAVVSSEGLDLAVKGLELLGE